MKKIIIMFALGALLLPFASMAADGNDIDVYMFTSTGCPVCAAAKAHFETLKREQYPNLNVKEYDLRKNPVYISRFADFAKAYNVSTDHVPVIFIGETAIEGFKETEVNQALENCNNTECPNPMDIVKKYLEENPQEKPDIPAQTNKRLIGYIVLGVVVVGIFLLIINKR